MKQTALAKSGGSSKTTSEHAAILVLDTNHITALGYSGPLSDRLRQPLAGANQDTATTIITVEEQLRGWLGEIRKLTDPHDQIFAYSELQNRVTLFAAWIVLPWDVDSANTFVRLRKPLPRIGTLELKIASICLAHDAVLLTRNLSDFRQVPGLRVENWID